MLSSNIKLGPIKATMELWPNKLVTCDITDITTNTTFEAKSLRLEEYEMMTTINELTEKYNISPEDKKMLIEKVDNWGDSKYNEGSFDEVVSNAGADL